MTTASDFIFAVGVFVVGPIAGMFVAIKMHSMVREYKFRRQMA